MHCIGLRTNATKFAPIAAPIEVFATITSLKSTNRNRLRLTIGDGGV